MEQSVLTGMVRKPYTCLGQCSANTVTQHAGRAGVFPCWASFWKFCSSQTIGCGHCGNLEMPTGGFGVGQGRGLFPDCDGQGLPAHA